MYNNFYLDMKTSFQGRRDESLERPCIGKSEKHNANKYALSRKKELTYVINSQSGEKLRM